LADEAEKQRKADEAEAKRKADEVLPMMVIFRVLCHRRVSSRQG
jgi:hypothetical protein